MMTREEAIEELERLLSHWDDLENGKRSFQWYSKDAVEVSITSLRSVSRELVEKVWRGEWVGSADGYADGELVYDIWECSHCGYVIDEEDDPDMLPKFCPKCYAAMTDEAVDILLRRLETLKDETD